VPDRLPPPDARETTRESGAERRLLVIAAAAFLAYLLYLTLDLRFDLFRSDIASYWKQSFEWRAPYSTWWVPGYSLVIAALRGLTLGLLPPLAVMVPIAAVSYLVAVRAAFRLAREAGSPRAFEIGLLFAIFPFVGLTYSVYPMSDVSAIALFLLAVVELQRGRWGRFTLFAAGAMFFHKVMWFFVPPLLAIAFFTHPAARRVVPLAFLPLVAWAVGGWFHFHHPLWFVRFNYETHTVVKEGLPVFGGLIQTLQGGTTPKLWKGVVILAVLVAALIAAWSCWRRRLWAGLSVALTIAFLVAAVNAYEIWVAVRYSRLLVVPIALASAAVAGARDTAGSARPAGTASSTGRRLLEGVGWAAALLSNFGFGHYLAHYFD
jgi:hypothetical protein